MGKKIVSGISGFICILMMMVLTVLLWPFVIAYYAFKTVIFPICVFEGYFNHWKDESDETFEQRQTKKGGEENAKEGI